MFRQYLLSCNCQLFSPHNYQLNQSRSPPPHTNRTQLPSKRSLKSHSHSRHRQLHQHHKPIRKSDQTDNQTNRNIKIVVLSSRIPSKITLDSDYQLKTPTVPITKISLINTKNPKYQNTTKLKQNFTAACPVRSINYQTRIIPSGSTNNPSILRDIAVNSNLNQHIKLVESTKPIINDNYLQCRENSAQTTLAGSLAPPQHLEKLPCNPQSFDKQPYAYIQLGNKSSICEEKREVRPKAAQNFSRLSRLSQMINDKEEAESVYQGEKCHQQGGVQYSRVLISCKKLMQQKNGVLEGTHRTKLFEYYPEPPKRSRQSSTFQKVNLMPSSLR